MTARHEANGSGPAMDAAGLEDGGVTELANGLGQALVGFTTHVLAPAVARSLAAELGRSPGPSRRPSKRQRPVVAPPLVAYLRLQEAHEALLANRSTIEVSDDEARVLAALVMLARQAAVSVLGDAEAVEEAVVLGLAADLAQAWSDTAGAQRALYVALTGTEIDHDAIAAMVRDR